MTTDRRDFARAHTAWRDALLCSTALVTGALAFVPQTAMAQAVIDGGDHEIVDGDGLGEGAPASTRPSPWNVGGMLMIGDAGTGLLTIRNGGAVTNIHGYVGYGSGSTGDVVVTGADSTWTNGSQLYVGYEGAGALTIADGGLVTGHAGWIGNLPGSTGEVTVTGAGSHLAVTFGDLVVAAGTGGTLTIADGGLVTNVEGHIGNGGGVAGSVTVSGAGSTWTNSSSLNVGRFGDGALTISGGGVVNANGVTIAAQAGGTGVLTIGAESTDPLDATAAGALNSPILTFGDGDGVLNFNHTSADYDFAAAIGGAGLVNLYAGHTILSGNSTFTGDTTLHGGTLTLGHDNALGASTLTTLGSVVDYVDGVDIGNAIVIDSNTTQFQVLTGSATQSGVISENNGPRPFEKIGAGELVLTNDNTWTGETTISAGALTFDGGSVAVAGSLYIGRTGGDDAALNIHNGGAVSNSVGSIGSAAGSIGEVTVTGAGSTWTNSSDLQIGQEGAGALLIENGGAVSNTLGVIGNFADSEGMVTVTGADSSWTNSGDLYVGNLGAGVLTIENGGAVGNTDGFIGASTGSTGEVIVTGADSSWTNSGDLFVGELGHGALTVSDGGAVSNTAGYIGTYASSTGEVIVTGADSSWTNSGVLRVGDEGAGALTVADGAVVSNTEGWLARLFGSSGEATVTGAGSTWTNSNFLVVGNGGDGVLTVAVGGAVNNAAGYIGIDSSSTGEVTVTGADSSWTNNGVLHVGHGGDGVLRIENGGAVSNMAGRLAYNTGSTGEVTVTGAGASWTNNGGLFVGDLGDGVLRIENGGAVSNANGVIGGSNDATGAVTVTGAGSSWANNSSLSVGSFGDGVLTVADGGLVSADGVIIAFGGASAGTLNFGAAAGDAAVAAGALDTPTIGFGTGAGAIVFNHTDTDFEVDANISGDGTIRILAGRTILSGANTYTGSTLLEGGVLTLGSNTALGASTLTTTGSVVDYADGVDIANSIVIDSGTTQFQVVIGSATQSGVISESNGPRPFEKIGAGELVLTAANSWTGETTIGAGTLTFDGGSLALAEQLNIGRADGDEATLNIVNGGAVGNAVGYIGLFAGSAGEVTVTGAGSTWTNSDELHVGLFGDGALSIENGGAVSSMDGIIGRFAGSTGEVIVTGSDSSWTNTVALNVGSLGQGGLTVADGGRVESGAGAIGVGFGGAGAALITGAGSQWSNSGDLHVGEVGTGSLTIANGGMVSNVDGVIGVCACTSGAVLVTGAGSQWTNSGELRVGLSGSGALTIADSALVSAGHVVIANVVPSAGTLNIGAAALDAAAAAGTLDAATVAFGAGTGTLVFNHIEDDYDFDPVISGAGTIDHRAGFTTLTGDSSAFTGTTSLQGGTLIVDGALGGSMSVIDAILGGAGTLGNVALGAGAILAPGNSIGTLNIAGNLGFGAGSIYEVEVNDGGNVAGVNNDWVHATGIATIDSGASVHVTPVNGTDDGSTYTPGTIYTILTADGGITGAFGGVTDSFAFLRSLLSYDANNVYLTLNVAMEFQDVARTLNQQGVAGAANALGAGNPIYDTILLMTEEEARAAFDALSGEAYGSAGSAAFNTAQQLRNLLQMRLQMFSGGQVASAGFAPAAGDAVPAGAPSFWGRLFGSWGTSDGDANVAKLDRNSVGFLIGADKPVGENGRIGIALGYSRSSFDVSALSSSGDSDNFHIAGYAGTKLGAVDLGATLGYSYGKSKAERTVIVGGLTDNLTASYDSHTLQASVEAGIDFDMGSIVLTPFAGFAATHVETDGFTETGGPSALTIAASSNTTGTSTLGLRARREAGQVALSGSLAWRHAFGDVDPATRAAFASAPANPFTTRGAPVAENTLALEAGLGLKLDAGTTLTFGYAGEYASDARDHGLRAELRIEF